MRLSDRYPKLDELASLYGAPLDSLATLPDSDRPYMDLRGACHWVARGVPAHGDTADHLAFLTTIETFLSEFGPSEAHRKKLWKKLSAPGQVTNFLDTVAEAALALQLRRGGTPVELEVPFDSENPNSKDTDIVATLRGKRVWLDVISIQPEAPLFVSDSPFATRSASDVIEDFARRASTKYNKKFRDAVRAGQAECVGVLMNIIKADELIVTLLPGMICGERQPDAPASLWDKHPNLDFVYVHTLRKLPKSELLHSVPLIQWLRSAPSSPSV